MICLGIDSSSVAGSACIIKDGVLLAENFRDVGLTHSETLAPTVDSTLKAAGVEMKDVDLIAVTCGPGSFTGIRIGVALAKGLAFPLNIPAVGVLSTEALAFPFRNYSGLVVPVIDARRSRVFYSLYKNEEKVQDAAIIGIDELGDKLGTEPALLVGDGAELCYNQLKDRCNLVMAPAMLRNIRASAAAEAGLRIFEEKGAAPATELRPVYIQMSQAERTLKEKQSKSL